MKNNIFKVGIGQGFFYDPKKHVSLMYRRLKNHYTLDHIVRIRIRQNIKTISGVPLFKKKRVSRKHCSYFNEQYINIKYMSWLNPPAKPYLTNCDFIKLNYDNDVKARKQR